MHSDDKASPSQFWSFSENAHVKDGHMCDETSTCFKRSYSLIVSYSLAVSNYFESKSDFYSLLIIVGLIYLDKNNL